MIPYVLVAGATALSGWISSIRGLRALWWVLAPVLLVVFSAVRYGIGSDYFLYESFFTRLSTSSFTEAIGQFPVEWGFSVLMYIVRTFTDDLHIFFGVCAALTVLPVVIGIRRISLRPTLSLFLYVALAYYPASFNAVRQSIAASFLFLAETYRYDRRWLWLLLSFAAALFHSSAVVVIVVLFATQWWRVTILQVLLTTVAAFVGGILLFQFGWVTSLLGQLNDRYAGYIGTETGAGAGTLLLLIAHIALITLCLTLRRRPKDGSRDGTDRYLTFYFISALVLALALTNWLAGRFETYFGLFGILAVPHALAGRKNEKAITTAVVIFALLYLAIHVSFYNGITPYRTSPGT